MKVEGMIADTPRDRTFFAGGRCLVGLTFDAEIHDVVSANSTVINDDIPSPKRNRIPLLDLKTLLAFSPAFYGTGLGLAE